MTAPDLLEPFTARAAFAGPGAHGDGPALVAALLDDIAAGCEEAGCSLIGHIKCHVEETGWDGDRAFHCNLTSRDSGARCSSPVTRTGAGAGAPRSAPTPQSAPASQPPRPVRRDGEAPALLMDLAVLVYGLTRDEVEAVVRRALAISSAASGGVWSLSPAAPHHHAS